MATNIFNSVPVPPSDGVGASISLVGQGLKTFVIGGTFEATVVIEILIGGLFAPAFIIDKPSQFRDVPIIAEDVRVRIVNYRSGAPTVLVGGSPSVDVFATLILPPGDGTGVALDTSLFGQNKTFIVGGDFDATLTLEGAEDIAGPWAPLVRIDKPFNFFNTNIITRFVRVVVSNYRSGTMTASLGAADFNAGGGGDTLQDAYDNSADGRIVTDNTRVALKVRDGSGLLLPDILIVEDNVGAAIFAVDAAGKLTFASIAVAGNGSAANPTWGFSSTPGLGMYKGVGNRLSFAVSNVERMNLTSGQFHLSLTGSVATPAIVLANDLDSGLLRIGANNYGMSMGGLLAMSWNSSQHTVIPQGKRLVLDTDEDSYIVATGDDNIAIFTSGFNAFSIGPSLISSNRTFSTVVGSAAAPGIRNSGDANTGTFNPTIGEYAITCGGTEVARFDESVGVDEMRFMLYDVTAGTLVRVSRGNADSGKAGFRVLIVPN